MNFLKLIKYVYLLLTLYVLVLVSVTSLSVYNIFGSIVFLWSIYLLFSLGYRINKSKVIKSKKEIKYESWIINRGGKTPIMIGLFSIFASMIAAYFYTGQTPLSLLNLIINDTSIYYEYQSYAKDQMIHVFTLKKIPFILCMFFVKFILFYGYISYIIIKEKITFAEKISLLLITIAHIYFGFARGTNFEFFELLLLIVFVLFMKVYKKHFYLLKRIPIILGLSAIMIYAFYSRIIDRGVDFNVNSSFEFHVDANGFMNTYFPEITQFSMILYNYFGFGFVYISNFLNNIWFSSLNNFFYALIPKGFELNGASIQDRTWNFINMRARWHPDSMVFINDYGVIILAIIIIILGILSRALSEAKTTNTMSFLAQFLIFLQLVSLPIGNFVFISSATLLILMTTTAYFFWKKFFNRKIKFK